MAQDRTKEFLATVQTLRSRQGLMGSTTQAQNANRRAPREQSDFSQRFNKGAKKIGHDIAAACEKLEKLAILASKRVVYDDRPKEIQQLTYYIKEDIDHLNQSIAQLRDFVKMHNTSLTQHKTHTSNVVNSLQAKLASMSKRFKKVLETRAQNWKQARQRRDQFSSAPSFLPAPSGSSSLLEKEADTFSLEMPQQELAMVGNESAYVQERADAMENVERTIVELGSMFKQLAEMVHDQGESLSLIDANIEETEMNVEAAHSQLTQYLSSVSSNRWLMLKIFGVLIFFFIIFVVFLA